MKQKKAHLVLLYKISVSETNTSKRVLRIHQCRYIISYTISKDKLDIRGFVLYSSCLSNRTWKFFFSLTWPWIKFRALHLCLFDLEILIGAFKPLINHLLMIYVIPGRRDWIFVWLSMSWFFIIEGECFVSRIILLFSFIKWSHDGMIVFWFYTSLSKIDFRDKRWIQYSALIVSDVKSRRTRIHVCIIYKKRSRTLRTKKKKKCVGVGKDRRPKK